MKKEKASKIPAGTKICPSCLKKGKSIVMTKMNDKYVCSVCQTWMPVVDETKEEKKARLKKELADLE